MVSLLKKIGRAASLTEQGEEPLLRELVGSVIQSPPPPPAEPSAADLTKRFRAEALALSVAFSAAHEDRAAVAAALGETLESWERRLAAGGPALRAFLRSGALGCAVGALFGSAQFDAPLRDAAAAVGGAPGAAGAAGAAERGAQGGALARLLLAASSAPPALLSELLLLLAGANGAAERCRSGPLAARGIAAEEDSRWVLRLVVTTLTDGGEAEALEVSRTRGAAERALGAAAASLAESPGDGHERRPPPRKLPVGAEVWACWPGDGCWYRAQVKTSSRRRLQVSWLAAPAQAGGESDIDEYVASPAPEECASFMELGRSAVIPVAEVAGRPPAVSEGDPWQESWGRSLSAVQEHDHHFRELRSLCSRIESLRRGGGSSAGPEEEPPLCGAAVTLCAFREEAEERAEGLGCVASLSSDEVRGLEEAMARRSRTTEAELEAAGAESLRAAAAVEAARARRQELLEQLRAAGEELSAAEAALGAARAREQRLCAGRAQSAEELARRHQAAREQAGMARERQEVLTRAAAASREVERQLAARAAAVADAAALREALCGQEQAVRSTCVASNRARRRVLQELLASWHECIWGPGAAALSQHREQMGRLRHAHGQALVIVDSALRDAEQAVLPEKSRTSGAGMLEALFGHNESDDESDDDAVAECMSRVAPKYRKMRHQLSKNLERLAELAARSRAAEKASPGDPGTPSSPAAGQVGRLEQVLYSGSPAA